MTYEKNSSFSYWRKKDLKSCSNSYDLCEKSFKNKNGYLRIQIKTHFPIYSYPSRTYGQTDSKNIKASLLKNQALYCLKLGGEYQVIKTYPEGVLLNTHSLHITNNC